MVREVNDSTVAGSLGRGYRELNQQLARDNGELRQQLSVAINENALQREELLRKDVRIIDLERQVQELIRIKKKFEKILDVVNSQTSIESTFKKDQSNSDKESTRSNNRTYTNETGDETTTIDELEEQGAEEDAEVEEIVTNSRNFTSKPLDRISEGSEENASPTTKYSESLDPPDVTSVPALKPERVLQTPSVWNCLDSIETPQSAETLNESTGLKISKTMNASSPIHPVGRNSTANVNTNDMFQSTPKRTVAPTNSEPRYNLRKRTKV